VFVYAASSNDPVLTAENAYKNLNQRETSSFECSDCGNHMHVVASASPEPYCVSCGSDRVIESNRQVSETASFINDKELSSIHCKTCDTENVMPTTAVLAAKSEVHCVMCGSSLRVVSEIKAGDKVKADFADAPPVVNNGGGSMDAAGGEDEFPNLDGIEDAAAGAEGDDTDDNNDDTEEADAVEDSAEEGKDFGEDAGFGDEVPDFSNLEGVEAPGNAEELFLDAYNPAEGDAPAAEGEPLMDALELDDTPESLTFVSKASTLLAMKGAHVVAFATATTVGRNADILHTPEYAKSVVITAGRTGARKALAKFGFRNITIKPTDTAAVAKGVATARAAFAAVQTKKDAVFADSIAIAAAGLARGLWRNEPNPIRAAIEHQLSTNMNARSARTVATKIMTEHGLEYSKTLVTYANKLASMSVTARKEFADMLDLVSDDTADEEITSDAEVGDDVDGLDDLDDVTARLRTPATAALFQAPRSRIREHSSTAQTASVSATVSASAVLSGKEPLSFSF
jgi:ribosomal protein S27E